MSNSLCETLKCTDFENLTWTTANNKSCVVFVNPCHLYLENCQRNKNGKDELYEIPKDECQTICQETLCTLEPNPVCGIYKGSPWTFTNECEMNKHIYTYGKVYEVYSMGKCEDNYRTTTETQDCIDVLCYVMYKNIKYNYKFKHSCKQTGLKHFFSTFPRCYGRGKN